jgi:hypothetical protein
MRSHTTASRVAQRSYSYLGSILFVCRADRHHEDRQAPKAYQPPGQKPRDSSVNHFRSIG